MPFQENKSFDLLIKKAAEHYGKNLPFVLYRTPNSHFVKAIFLDGDQVKHTGDFSDTGFIFYPFNSNANSLLFTSNKIIEVSYQIKESNPNKGIILNNTGKAEHLDLVNKAILEIKSGPLQKVVLSRKILAKTAKTAFQIYEGMLNSYPKAFNYLFFHPQVGTWIGATPETLLKSSKKKVTTNSLAGTLPVLEDKKPNWTTKEIEEQQLVTDYVVDALKKHTMDIAVTNPASVRAGNLWHLKSIISGSLKQNTNIGNILKSLHPTPAVCGLPKNKAKNFILNNENYNRTFYTGFLGELNFKDSNTSELFVNLRCMQLDKGNASIYVGGGITKDSNAQKEWEETCHKAKTMLSLL